jgi:hypothetical protein
MWMRRLGLGELVPRWPVFRDDTVVASKENEETLG